jgi:hypothetical protein
MIKSIGNGEYKLFSKKTGKPLSKAGSKEAAKKRERQVEFFKHYKGKK